MTPADSPPADTPPAFGAAVRGVIGGVLMGLANLVPGVSGGTMLLAAGVYTAFIEAVADVTTLRFRARSLFVLGAVLIGAAGAIVGLAGPVRDLVIHHRWVMYSLFIGLTLGGVPVIWRRLAPVKPAGWAGAACGLAAMIALAWLQMNAPDRGGDPGASSYLLLFIAGLAGGSAMILPGVSGGYLLLILGQYVIILDAIANGKDAARAGDLAAFMPQMHVFIPVGLGVVVGVVGVSNAMKTLLHRFPQATLGVLLGLLVGAVFGIWPFQRGAPTPDVEPKHWPIEFFTPDGMQIAASLGLMVVALGAALLIAKLDRPDPESDPDPVPAPEAADG